jgi:hypothetical protein
MKHAYTQELKNLREGDLFKAANNKRKYKLIRKNIDTCVVMDALNQKMLIKSSDKQVVRLNNFR